jgi:hypothetical protein
VGPRAGMDDMEKRKFLTLPGLELRPLRRPARSQLLYRLRYPGSKQNFISLEFYHERHERKYIFKYACVILATLPALCR